MPPFASHADTIEAAIVRGEAAKQPLVASWQRSSRLHELNPNQLHAPQRLTAQELKETQEKLGLLLSSCASNLDQLYLAVGDVSSSRADLTAGFSRLISVAVLDTARRIETEHFSQLFGDARILLATSDEKQPDPLRGAALIAVNGDDLVIGATRGARNIYGLSEADFSNPQPLSELHGQKVDLARNLAMAEHRVIQQALASAGGNVSAAARAMGINRATLHRKLNKFRDQD